MSTATIDAEILTKAALTLIEEAYRGPADPAGTWFVDNEPDCGFLGVLTGVDAATASRPFRSGDPATLASHAGHLRFSLSLANRAAKGEEPYASADWAESWAEHEVDGAAWSELVSGLQREYDSYREFLASGGAWKDADLLTGTLSQIAHAAWHLGAIRQGLGLVVTPKKQA